MLLNEIIYSIQTVLNKGSKSDDSIYSNRFIYTFIKSYRAKLLRQSIDKYQEVNPFNFQTIDCLELELSILPECPCLTLNCKFLKSKYQLPRVIQSRNQLLLKVYTPDGTLINNSTLEEAKNFKYTRTKNNKMFWFIHNNFLVVVDPNNMLSHVQVKGLFEDPVELQTVKSCNNSKCFDPLTQNYPIDTYMLDTIRTMTYEEIMRYMNQSLNDLTNDSQGIVLNQKE